MRSVFTVRSKDDVDVHRIGYTYESLPAVNIKVYRSLQDVQLPNPEWPGLTREWIDRHISDQEEDEWFWTACNYSWECFVDEASQIFDQYVRIWREGRSGGWAVVEGLPPIEQWDAVQLAKWRRFVRLARAYADDVPYQMMSLIYLNRFREENYETADEALAHQFEQAYSKALLAS